MWGEFRVRNLWNMFKLIVFYNILVFTAHTTASRANLFVNFHFTNGLQMYDVWAISYP